MEVRFFQLKPKIEDHKMHSELGEISEDSANRINKVKENGGRIIAVGTTVLRILESSKNSMDKSFLSKVKQIFS